MPRISAAAASGLARLLVQYGGRLSLRRRGTEFQQGGAAGRRRGALHAGCGQGRHRGFFNPSNIYSDGRYEYFFAATTGWDGQPYGACLFRSSTPLDPGSWRAYDGHAYSIRYTDPYRQPDPGVKACAQIGPFTSPVGAVVRLRQSGDLARRLRRAT